MHNETFEDPEVYEPDTEPPPRRRSPRYLRATEKTAEGHSTSGQHCIVCGNHAYEKPYCILHLDEMPYVKALKEQLSD